MILGDSISAAYGMSLEQGWVALLERRLADNGMAANVVNASISGETSGGGLRRLPQLLNEYAPTLVVVELGGNDGLRGFPLATLRRTLSAIVSQAQASGARVLLLPMEIPPNYGQRYTRGFRQTFEQVAKETGCTLGPFILESFATDAGMKQPDGIHPTAAAQPLMLDSVYPAIVARLEEQ
ncbi:MAG: esterase TesA [Halioglobus sp.]